MSPRLKTFLALLGSLLLGGGLLFLALRGVDFGMVWTALQTATYGWLLPLILLTILSHVLRAWRWQLLLGALPDEHGQMKRPSFRVTFYSVMIGYMVNLAAPRLGEVARAANVSAQTRLRFPGVFGTVVVERVLDVLTLALALLSVGLLFGGRLAGVAEVFAANLQSALQGFPVLLLVLTGGVLLLALLGLLLVRRHRAATGAPKTSRLGGLLRAFRDGLASLLRVREKGAVLALTLGMWACYLFMADIPLRMLGLTATYDLGLLDSWALMNVGAVGMALPAPGGTGSFHYVTIQTLVHLFGVTESAAATYALLTHAASLVLYAVVGFVCLLLQGTSFRALRASAEAARTSGQAPSEPSPS
ncbi:MAG: flippase-like domain-containing protein [Rhodothermaceae bacterium]|nr:flippase-like domain-containing protein [Rhodothermaceae bacterium]